MRRVVAVILWLLCVPCSGQLTGPERVGLGQLVRVSAPAGPDEAVLFEVIEPDELDSEEVPFDGGVKLLFSSGCKPGRVRITALTFRVNAGGKPSIKRDRITITVGGGEVTPQPNPAEPVPVVVPPAPQPQKITRLTLVYEKSKHAIPSPVAAAFNRLNRSGVLCSVFDQDTVDGTGAIPDQYRVALEAAKREGLPCLVAQAGEVVVRTKRAPMTEAEIDEAVR